jgi:hypothetical protein
MIEMTGISGSGISESNASMVSLVFILQNENCGNNHNHYNHNVLPNINKVGGYFLPSIFETH